jgi:multidrug efflux pump subunit AcrA (membrane-fusion protein)
MANTDEAVPAVDAEEASPPRRRAPWVVWISAGVVLAAAGLAYGHSRARAKNAVRFETAAVDRGRVVSRVTASGTLSAIVTVQVGSQVSGRLQRIFVDYNSTVRKDQLIAQLDPALFEAAYEQAKANHVAALGNLAKAEAQARDADLQARRSQSLLADKLVAQADFDTAPHQILSQFLMEALALSVAGGLLGLILGVGAAQRLAAQFGWPTLVRPDVVLLSVCFSAFVGVVFGLYPAREASLLDPIDALRYE